MKSAGYAFAVVYAAFIIKHYLADFLLQTKWMAEQKERASGWVVPLAAHSAWHAALTGAIVLVVAPGLWWLALIDFIVHASIDRGKGLLNERLHVAPFTDGRWWWIFGADQALHQLTHLGFVVVLLSS